MEYFTLPKSVLDRLPSAIMKGVLVALLELADDNGLVSVSVRKLAKSLGMEYQPLRTVLKHLYANAVANAALNAAPNANPTQPLTHITINDINDYKVCARKQQRKSNAALNAAPNANPNATKEAHSNPAYILPPYVEPQYAETWRKFNEHRKLIKKPYKSPQSERIAYNKMVDMAGNDPAKAKDMVERAILGQYQGLFPLKNNADIQHHPASVAKTKRDRGLFLATEIVSNSENLVNLYNGQGSDTINREN